MNPIGESSFRMLILRWLILIPLLIIFFDMTKYHGIAGPTVLGLVALLLVSATFTVVLSTSESEAAFASFNEGDKWALKGERNLGIDVDALNGLISIRDDETWFKDAMFRSANLVGYLSTVALFEITDVTSDEYVLKVTMVHNLSLAASLSMDGELLQPGSYISDWDEGWSSNPDGLLNLSEATFIDGEFGFDTKLAAAANETIIVHLERSSMAVKSMEIDMTAYARGYLNVDNFPNTTTDWDSVNAIDLLNVTSYETFDSTLIMDVAMSGNIEFEPYMAMVQDMPASEAFWEQTTYMNGTFNWDGIVDIAGLPANITNMWFNEDMAEAGITGFPIDLAKIYNPSGSGIPVDNGTLEIEAVDVNPEFSNLGYTTIDDPVYGAIDIYRLGFRNASLDNYVELWYYPAEGYLVGASIITPPMVFDLSFSFDMKTIPVASAQADVDAMVEQITEEKTYDQVVQSIGGGEQGGISQTLLLALGAVAVVVVGVVAFLLMRKKGP